jgi:hypothetical protein
MAAVATLKPGGEHAVQQTFPYVFQQDFQAGTSYFPSIVSPQMELMTGETFQSEYHRQKRNDAVQSVYNGIANDKAKERKLLTGTANYHLPKAVLGQRIFANPSLGAGSDSSARRDGGVNAPWTIVQNYVGTIQTVADNLVDDPMVGMGMVGGVMKTKDGFDYYNRNLQARIDQLNAMNSLSVGIPVPRGATTRPPLNSKMEGSVDKVEFFLLFRGLEDAITEGDLSRFTFDNLKKMMTTLFRFAPTADKQDFEDIIESTSGMRWNLRAYADDELGIQIPDANEKAFIETMALYMEGLNEYVAEMFKNINLSPRDKQTLSNSLIQTLGFKRLQKKSNATGVIRDVVTNGTNERVNQAAENFDDSFDGDDGGDAHFNHPAEAREDEDQNNAERAPFAGEGGDPNRDAWGAERAPGTREQRYAYFGEDDTPVMAQPLSLSGDTTIYQTPQYQMPVLYGLNSALTSLLPSTSSMSTWASELNKKLDDGTFSSMDDFVQKLIRAAEQAGISRDEFINNISYFKQELPGVFDAFLAENQPQQQAPVTEPPPEGVQVSDPLRNFLSSPVPRLPPSVPAFPSGSSGAAGAPGDRSLPMGVRTRADLQRLSGNALREFGRSLGEEFGGAYNARSGTNDSQQKLALIQRIKKVIPGF